MEKMSTAKTLNPKPIELEIPGRGGHLMLRQAKVDIHIGTYWKDGSYVYRARFEGFQVRLCECYELEDFQDIISISMEP